MEQYGLYKDGIAYLYGADVKHDVNKVYQTGQTPLLAKTYEAYGKIFSQTSNQNITPFGYRGYYTDSETGLFYLSSRYYDSSIQRFTQEDTYQDDNLQENYYGYCSANPVLYTDPSGHSILDTVMKAKTVFDAAAAVAKCASSFKNLLYTYTHDVLQYSYASNWVMKQYKVKGIWPFQTTNIYSNAQLQRVKVAKDNMYVCYTAGIFKKFWTTPSISIADWKTKWYANNFSVSQIQNISYFMYAWDPKTFSEIYYGTGIKARLF